MVYTAASVHASFESCLQGAVHPAMWHLMLLFCFEDPVLGVIIAGKKHVQGRL